MALPSLCPICSSGDEQLTVVTPHVAGDDTSFPPSRAFFHCAYCTVIFQWPTLTQDEEKKFYSSEFESFMRDRSGNVDFWGAAERHNASQGEATVRRKKYFEKLVLEKKNLLEIGCSSGFMLDYFLERGATVAGVEPSDLYRKHLLNIGHEVYENLDEVEGNFQFIVSFFVFEHIVDPFKFLQKSLDLLDADGQIILEIPSSMDPLFRLYDIPAFERFFWSKAHPFYYNPKSIGYLLDKFPIDYQVELGQRYDFSNHFRWALTGRPGGQNYFGDKLPWEFNAYYRNALISAGYHDTLVVTIRR